VSQKCCTNSILKLKLIQAITISHFIRIVLKQVHPDCGFSTSTKNKPRIIAFVDTKAVTLDKKFHQSERLQVSPYCHFVVAIEIVSRHVMDAIKQ